MAEVVLKPDPGSFPPGTKVKVYARTQPEGGGGLNGAPPGAILSEPTVAASGTLTVTGLTLGSSYVGWAVTGGVDRYLRFRVDDPGAVSLTRAEAETIAASDTATEKERAQAAEVLKAPKARVVVTKTANYTLTAEDEIVLADPTGGAITQTLPTPVGIGGVEYTVLNVTAGANAVTLATAAGAISGSATVTLSSAATFKGVTVVSDNANYWIV